MTIETPPVEQIAKLYAAASESKDPHMQQLAADTVRAVALGFSEAAYAQAMTRFLETAKGK